MKPTFLRSATLVLLAIAAFDAAAAPCPTTTVTPSSALPSATVGAAFSQSFTASNSNSGPFTFAVTSGLPAGSGLGFTSTGATTADLAGSPTQVGNYLVTVTASDSAGCSGGRTYPLNVGQGTQTISFTSSAPSNAQIGGAAYVVAATATSSLPVAFSIDASASAVCAIAGNSVTFQAAGTCIVNANQPGNANYAAAPQVQQSFAVGLAEQTITFTSTAPAGAVFNGPAYSVAATATSGLAVVFTIDASASGVCAIAGSNVTFQGVGTCVVNANQPGNASYAPAPQVQQSFAVGQATQTIAFTSGAPAAAAVGGAAYAVAATATSGLPVTFTIDASASTVCAIAGSTVTFQSTGTCVVNANQPGNANYAAAPQAQQSFAVGPGSQTITFTSSAPAAVVAGPSYGVTATATSGLPVTFAIDASASAVCSIAGSTITFQSAGTCVVNANQAGNANWNAAPQAQQSFAVGPGSQTITFTSSAPAAVVAGPSYGVTATATSGLPVTFAIDASASAVCSIAGSTITFQSAGTCVVNANQAGNANWNAAPQAQQSFAVGAGSQTITFTSAAPASAVFNGPAYSVAATATSGLAVVFTIDASASGVCAIAGSNVTFQGVGTCIVNANQPGNASYAPAPQVQQSFAVGQATQTIAFTSGAPAAAAVGGAAYAVAATATSGLPVTFTIDASASAVCAIAGSTVTFQSTGTCVVNANQPGNANYAAAPQAQQSFAVGPGSQTITFTSSAPAAVVAGPSYGVTATATSGLPVTFAIDASASAVCSIAGSTITFQSAGTCVVNANQAGNANWNAAPQAQQSFAVGPGSQTITFTSSAPAAVVAGPSYGVTATATSGLPVTFAIDASASAVCSIAGSTITFQTAGTCVVNANQAGNANWNAAPQAQQSFAVEPGSQSITFDTSAPSNANVGGTYAVAATATSGLAVVFTIDASASAVCSIAGSTVSFTSGGTCVVNANQPGDANWTAAPQVQQTFTVNVCIDLAPGQMVAPGATFCVFNSSGADAEYTYLPINNSPTSDVNGLALTGTGIQAVTGPPTPRPEASDLALAPLVEEAPADMHDIVGMPDRRPLGRAHDVTDLVPLPMGGTTSLVVGQLIDLNVAIGGCSVAPDIRKARVEAITTPQFAGQSVIYALQEVVETTSGAADWHPPVPGGYATIDFQNIINAFVQAPPGVTANGSGSLGGLLRTGMLDTATSALGPMSDVDANGGLVVLFTRKLNELSPPATAGLVQAIFQPRDLFSAASCSASNEAEILYMMVPDPTGMVNSNVRTVSLLYGNSSSALVHHFEHLHNATRRLYFNGAAPLEETWLDEGLAWLFQELTFFNTSVGLAPRGNIQLNTLTTGPNASVRVAAFNTFENTMYGHLRTFFYQLNASNGNKRMGPLRETAHSTGTTPNVHENVASNFAVVYNFLRYALDRKNTGDAALISALVNTTQVGRANLQTVLNVNLNDWARDFLVGAYTDDAGITGIAPEHTLPSWNFRSVFGGLGGFPLTTTPLTNGVTLNFLLGPGGGTRYTRFGVAAGGTGSLVLTEGGDAPSAPITGAVVRTK